MTKRVLAHAPYGSVIDGGYLHFTLYSRSARRVWLLLFERVEDDAPKQEVALERRGDDWTVSLPDEGLRFYLYRVSGTDLFAGDFDEHQWLLDPYARSIECAGDWGDPCGLEPGQVPTRGRAFPKCVVHDMPFDWGGDQPLQTPMEDSVLYEVHVRGYTASPDSGVSFPGTYRGLEEKIPYLKGLGVTAVELLPVHAFDEMEFYKLGGHRARLKNYWGYSTYGFFAPNGRYAADRNPGAAVNEFKEMVKAMHAAGLEVILDVVYNHTAEGDRHWPILHFKGLSPSVYYLLDEHGNMRNFTGCGNTVNCNHPVVADMIINSLRYWVEEMHVDGFRFDLASVLCRGTNGEPMPNPPLIHRIAEDPVLRHVKLIAEPWDAAGMYQVGSFPGQGWSEWNGRYRDDVRMFWRGDDDKLGAFATRISGSADLYHHQTPQQSVNFITSHDGFTMMDLVSYKEKHNEANGEHNRDGESHNFSQNFGIEGAVEDAAIKGRRLKQIKNYMATLMLSQGVPMLVAGDEFGRTQSGNNNAYCQDNERSWIDWQLLEENTELYQFTRDMIAFRHQHTVLRRFRFLDGPLDHHEHPDVQWLADDGGEVDWSQDRALGMLLHGDSSHTGRSQDGEHLFIIFNGSERSLDFRLPPSPSGQSWSLAVKTGRIELFEEHVQVEALSVIVFTAS